ncbi:MAG: hypothetical protein ABIK45_09085 [Pseudomonadota bacterium]
MTDINSMRLFNFYGKNGSIKIDIDRQIIFRNNTGNGLGSFRESIISNRVHLSYLGIDLYNSFPALSSLETLTTIYLRGRFGQHKSKAQITFEYEGKMLSMTAERISQGKGQIPLLKLGLNNSDRHIFLNEIYAIQMSSAIKKAENWLAPSHATP